MIELGEAVIVRSGRTIFRHLNWTIQDGEHWVITGRNGSGKTTLLEAIAGMHPMPAGHIRYDFIDGATWDERYRQRQQTICYIPVHAVHAFVKGHHDLYYQQRYYATADEGLPRVRSILGDYVHRLERMQVPACFDVTPLLDIEVTRLSNGQLKKLMILKYLLKQVPRLLLLDYPFEGLDAGSRMDLCNFIDFIATTHGVQVILTDHHHQLPAVINRKLVLDNAAIVQQDTITPQAGAGPNDTRKAPPERNLQEAVVEMRDLSIQYGHRVIIDKLNWTIRRGERWALTGRNGSGKTTLFSLMYADHPMAYSQQVYLFGRRRGTGESIWDVKKRINYSGPEQVNYLNPQGIHVSAHEYIRRVNNTVDEHVLARLVDYFNAGSFIDRPVKSLSSGQLQLMLLINCFLTDKELLLLDEPFQFLDPTCKTLVQEYIQLHLHEDRTLVLITHYEDDIARWTNHRMVLG